MHRAGDAPMSEAADVADDFADDVDERLDEALEETFPASDPIAVSPELDAPGAHAVLTVGHTTRPIGEFVALLRGHGVARLVDVRTVPRSRHNPQFNGDALAASLAAAAIGYSHAPALGGLRSPRPGSLNGGWRNRSFQGYADYMQTAPFAAAVTALVGLAGHDNLRALICDGPSLLVYVGAWQLQPFDARQRRGHGMRRRQKGPCGSPGDERTDGNRHGACPRLLRAAANAAAMRYSSVKPSFSVTCQCATLPSTTWPRVSVRVNHWMLRTVSLALAMAVETASSMLVGDEPVSSSIL